MATSDLALVDTNVLVNSVYEGAEHFAPSRTLIERAKASDAGLCVLPQNIAEFYAAVTSAKRVTEPKTADEALAAIDAFLALRGLELLPLPADVVSRLLELLRANPVTGLRVYDFHLVAAMLGSGVKRIYTFNTRDFERFSELEVLLPSDYERPSSESSAE